MNEAPEAGAVQKHAGGRPTDYKPEYCQHVVEAMRAGFSLTAFAGIIGVARSTINAWMGAHEEFSEAVSRAKAGRLLHWEEAAIRVAKEGGAPGTATMLIVGLKNMAPDEYADKQEIKHSGTIARSMMELTDDELAEMAAGRSPRDPEAQTR